MAVTFERFHYLQQSGFDVESGDWLHLSAEPFPVSASYIADADEIVSYMMFRLEVNTPLGWVEIGNFASVPEVIETLPSGKRFTSKFYDSVLLDSLALETLNIEFEQPIWVMGAQVIDISNYVLQYRYKVSAFLSDGYEVVPVQTTPTLRCLKGGRSRNFEDWGNVLTAGSYAYRKEAQTMMAFLVVGSRHVKVYDSLDVHFNGDLNGFNVVRVVAPSGRTVFVDVGGEIAKYKVTSNTLCINEQTVVRFRTTYGYTDALYFDGKRYKRRTTNRETFIRRHGTWVSYVEDSTQYPVYDARLRNGVRVTKHNVDETLVVTSSQIVRSEVLAQLAMAKSVLVGEYQLPTNARMYVLSATSFDDVSPTEATNLAVELVGESSIAAQ